MVVGKQSMKASIKPHSGKWLIVEMEFWGQEYVNMEVPWHIEEFAAPNAPALE